MSDREHQELLISLEHKLTELACSTRPGLVQERTSDPIDEARSESSLALAVGSMSLNWQTKTSINIALAKIRDGDYGTCESCHNPIPVKRLRAVPWAAHCISCQSAIESRTPCRGIRTEYSLGA